MWKINQFMLFENTNSMIWSENPSYRPHPVGLGYLVPQYLPRVHSYSDAPQRNHATTHCNKVGRTLVELDLFITPLLYILHLSLLCYIPSCFLIKGTSNIRHTPTLGNSQLEFSPTISLAKTSIDCQGTRMTQMTKDFTMRHDENYVE